MSISRAAVLQSLVLDESLRQYQSAAVNTVQNLASTFTGIAHALQKQKVQSTNVEQNVQKQLNTLAISMNEHASTIEEIKAEQASMLARIMDNARYRAGSKEGRDILKRLERLERLLDVEDEDEEEEGEGDGLDGKVGVNENGERSSIRRQRSAVSGYDGDADAAGDSGTSGEKQSTEGRRTLQKGNRRGTLNDPSSSSSSFGGVGDGDAETPRTARRGNRNSAASSQPGSSSSNSGSSDGALSSSGSGKSGASAGGMGTGNINTKSLSIATRIDSMETRQRQLEHFIKSQTGSHIENRLQMVLSEAEPSVLQSRLEANQRLETMSKAVEKLDGIVASFNTRMTQFENTIKSVVDEMRTNSQQQAEERVSLTNVITSALEQLEQTRGALEERVEATTQLVHSEIHEQAAVLGRLSQSVEGKADVRLVLDKVSRQEWAAQVRRLQQADDDIASRSVLREEYKHELDQLRDTMLEDQTLRQHNIARLANELQVVVQDLSGKASKADLVDVANVLNSFPKVHEELDHLKLFVDQEIASKQDLHMLQESVVNHKQLRRQLDRLLRSLSEEVRRGDNAGLLPGSGGTAGVGGSGAGFSGSRVCGTCLTKTSLTKGSACLSCAARLQPSATQRRGGGLADAAAAVAGGSLPANLLVPTKGGGFAVTTPRRIEVAVTRDRLLGPSAMSSSSSSTGGHGNDGGASNQLQHHSHDGNSSTMYIPPSGVPMSGRNGGGGAGAGGGGDMRPVTADVIGSARGSSVRRERGSDGRLFTSTGVRTHVLVGKNGRPIG